MESSILKTDERGLSIDYLENCMEYRDGGLFWKQNRPITHFSSTKSSKTWHKRFAGRACGSANSTKDRSAYLRVGLKIGLKVKLFLCHRLIWALQNGYFPDGYIDHINGDPQDNRIENLREVTNRENCLNAHMYKHNTTGITGVCWDSVAGAWRISGGGHYSGNFEYLGITKDKFEAVCIRRSWEVLNGYSDRHGKQARCKIREYKDSKLPQFPTGVCIREMDEYGSPLE